VQWASFDVPGFAGSGLDREPFKANVNLSQMS